MDLLGLLESSDGLTGPLDRVPAHLELTVLPLELLLVGGVGGELHLESSDGSTGPLDRVLAQLELTVPPFVDPPLWSSVAPVPPKPPDMHPSPFPHPQPSASTEGT